MKKRKSILTSIANLASTMVLKSLKTLAMIDGCTNPDSEYNVFWFKEQCLAVIPDSGVW